MFLLNYNNPQWSKDINCKAFNDCSDRTITDNGSTGIALITSNSFSKKTNSDIFHLGVDTTIALGLASINNPKYLKYAKTGVVILGGLYLFGRIVNSNFE